MFGMKKYLLIALTLGGLSLTTVGAANARPHGPNIKKMLFKDLDLSEEQRSELKEMHQRKKEFRKDGKKGERKDWMISYLNGETSRSAIYSNIEQKFEQGHAFHKENLLEMLDFIDTLDREQRNQFLENIDRLKGRVEKKRAKMKERRGNRGKKKAVFMEKLFSDVSLTRNQERKVEELRETQAERKNVRKEGPKRFIVFEKYASGEKTRAQILSEFNRAGKEKHQNKHEATDLWLSLLSSLDDEQKDQLVHNMEELREKREQRREKRKERRKERRGKKERLDFDSDGME